MKIKESVRMLPDKILKRKLAKKEKQKLKVLEQKRAQDNEEADPDTEQAENGKNSHLLHVLI